jgi:hypothetical protein
MADWVPGYIREQQNRQDRERDRREMLRPVGPPTGNGNGGGCITFPLGILGIVLAGVAIIAVYFFNTIDDDEQAPAPAVTGRLTVVAPDTLQGRPLNTDSQFDEARNLVQTRLASIGGAKQTFSRVYGTSNDDLIYVGGGVGTFKNFAAQADADLSAVEDGHAQQVRSVDPGPFGGAAKCGEYTWSGVRIGVCAWVDRGTIGELAFDNSDAAKAAKLLVAARGELEQQY